MFKKLLFFLSISLSTSYLLAQNEKITGSVKNEMNLGLPLVKVQLKGQSLGVTTDQEGNFELNVPNKTVGTLVFTLMGYEKQEVDLIGQLKIDVVLKEVLNENPC